MSCYHGDTDKTTLAEVAITFIIGAIIGVAAVQVSDHLMPTKAAHYNCAWCHKQPILNTVKKSSKLGTAPNLSTERAC